MNDIRIDRKARLEVASYSHLIGEVDAGLELASCLYFEAVEGFLLGGALDLVEKWFARRDSKPRVVLVSDVEARSPRYTMRTLRQAASDPLTSASFATLQFFPKGRTTIDDTWRPAVYSALSMQRAISAFFCATGEIDEGAKVACLREGSVVFRSCAAYAFEFPEQFSPLGYFWGISVEPAGDVGYWARPKANRLSNWRDNTKIGIASAGERRFYSACGGHVRDAYPLMLLSARHMSRTVGTANLAEEISRRPLGTVTAVGEQFLWRIPPEKLAEAQRLLDDNDISLSGRRLE